MRIRTWSAALIALALVGSSCSENGPVGPTLRVPGQISALVGGSGSVVISQVYGGGGNAGSFYKNDFIELHNRGTVAVSLSGWSVQYASAAGTTWAVTPLSPPPISISIEPGQYLLIQEAAGTTPGGGSAALPTPQASGTIAMALGAGKVALVSNTTPLTCGGPSATCTPVGLVDFVGYGSTATGFEGAGPTGTLTSAKSAIRNADACTDTDNNAADFTVGDPAPRNTSTIIICGESAPRVATTVPAAAGILPDPASISISFSELVDVTGNWFGISCAVSGPHTALVTGGPQNYVLSELGGFTPGEACTGTVFAAFVHDQDVIDPPDAMDADFTWSFSVAGVPVALPETRFSEIHYDNFDVDAGEAIEIEGPAGTDLSGWDIVLYNGNGGVAYNTVHLSGNIPATCGTRGVVVTTYPSNGIQNGAPDGFALVHGSTVIEFLSYEGSFAATDGPAAGRTSVDIGVAEDASPSGQSLQRRPSGPWNSPAASTFGACNTEEGGGTGGTAKSITFSGRTLSNPPLPVGFEDQLFATLHNGATTVETAFTWTSTTPDIASIDAKGVMHALAEGTATFVATAVADGTTGSISLPMIVATLGGTADYAGNAEFGIPSDGEASDDFIITRDQYTISYNKNRNTPNWVSYEFDKTHFGSNVDRCDCFTHDPALPSSFLHLTTADYTDAGTFAGYGIDRGHMARSHDFTSGSLDNARSYYLSNIIPQAADLNQGPWAILENYVGNRAENVSDNKEVYVIDGVVGSKGTIKNEGKIVMPASVWKVALILPRDKGLADIRDYRDILEVVAVIMPNNPGVRAVNWETYRTTVDEIERVSGYDLLALLPDKVERAIESNAKPAVAVTDGPYTSNEGAPVSFSGTGSFDGDGNIVDYAWKFGDGASATGNVVSHTYSQDGTWMVRLIVTDNLGVADTSFTTSTVANVTPIVAPFAGATLLPGETYSAAGSFTDPGADPWSATANYGDGPAVETLLLSGKTFALSHTYMSRGMYIVTVRVSDDDVTSSRTQSVTVITPTEALDQAADMIKDITGAANLNSGNGNSLSAKIDAAQKQIANGNSTAAANQLSALLNELDAMVRSRRVSTEDAEPLRTMVERVIRSISL